MRQIVEDLLELSRREMQQHPPDERVDMRAQLDVLLHEAGAPSRGRHRVTLEDTAGVDLLGSSKDLHSAFSNLVSNAVHYTPVDRQVHLERAWRTVADRKHAGQRLDVYVRVRRGASA